MKINGLAQIISEKPKRGLFGLEMGTDRERSRLRNPAKPISAEQIFRSLQREFQSEHPCGEEGDP